MSPEPSVGRLVHYVSYGTPGGEYGQENRAAIITAVNFSLRSVSLCVLNPTGLFFNEGVKYDDAERLGGTWHGPDRV